MGSCRLEDSDVASLPQGRARPRLRHREWDPTNVNAPIGSNRAGLGRRPPYGSVTSSDFSHASVIWLTNAS